MNLIRMPLSIKTSLLRISSYACSHSYSDVVDLILITILSGHSDSCALLLQFVARLCKAILEFILMYYMSTRIMPG